MRPLRLATIALFLAAVTNCAVYSQQPGYGSPPGAPPQYGGDPHQGQDPRYYDQGRGYDDWRSPRNEVGFFYDELSPYGDWVFTRDYGWAWFPRDVRPYWRPYTEGRWVDSDYGWTWVSYEPFGWATYHYGRWAWDPRFGWLWVPGTIWGPAWVSWQHGGGYVGWAPLPPAVGFEVGFGIRLGGFDLSIGIRPDAYSFVPERSFLQTHLSGYMVPTARNVTIIHNTTNITNYTYIDNRVVNRGVDVRRIEQVTGKRLQQYRVSRATAQTRSEVAGTEVRIYRPEKQKLDSVRVGPHANAGHAAEPGRGSGSTDQRPVANHRDAPPIEVAPRVDRVPRPSPQELDQRERRQQQELQKFQADEKRKVEKLQQQELVKARAQADRKQVEQRQQAEREALQQEQRNAAQQLQARLKAQREAALAKPPGKPAPQGDQKPAQKQQGKKNDKGQQQNDKGQQQQKDQKPGQDSKPDAPPPA